MRLPELLILLLPRRIFPPFRVKIGSTAQGTDLTILLSGEENDSVWPYIF